MFLGLSSMTDVRVGLRDCTSLLFVAAVQHWNLKTRLVLFVCLLLCASLVLAFSPSLPKKVIFCSSA